MNTTLSGSHIPARVLSYPGHRRPPLKRTHASHNLFPDLPPIQTACTPPSAINVVALAEDGNSALGGAPRDCGDQPIEVGVSPRSPASPPSPISSSSESSTSSLATPLEADDWERFHDGFAPPPHSPRPHLHPWPPTPNPNIPSELPPQACDSYHGWSGNSLFEMKRFWYRRHRVWWDYDEHCRHLHNYLAAASTSDSEGTLDATTYYPPSPALLPSRLTPWSGPNGTLFNTERIATDALALPRPGGPPRLQVHPPWAPVFPRFGDIEDLRDPSCEHLDRMFMNFPPYAISKLLYVEQMAMAAHDSARAPQHTLGRSPPTPPYTPPSPSVSPIDAPWSPGSVYSQDGRGVAFSTTAPSSTMMSPLPSRASGLHLYGALRWSDRWELLRRRLFPQSQAVSPTSTTSPTSPSPLLSPSESDRALSAPPVHLPPRPGTPLPDDEEQNNSNRAAFFAVHHLANSDAHSERAREPGVSTDPRRVGVGVCVCVGVGVCAESVDPGGRAHAPAAGAVDARVRLALPGSDPVVRLPSSSSSLSSSSSHPLRPRGDAARARLAPDGQDWDGDGDRDRDGRSPRTLADELGAALGIGLGGAGAGVQFSVAPPVGRVSSRFCFFLSEPEEGACGSEHEHEHELELGHAEIAQGLDVGGGDGALARVHVEAVPC